MANITRKLILASASPRRQELLKGLGLTFEIRVKDILEDAPGELKRGDIAVHLAEYKAEAYKKELQDDELLITADTIVWIDDTLLEKPVDHADAIRMLKKLSGHGHQVYSGVCLTTTKKQECFCTESTVWFNSLSEKQIEDYITHYRPFDKAGAYGAQECLPEGFNPCSKEEMDFLKAVGKPGLFEESLAVDIGKHVPVINRIEGSYFNVMGLPVVELWRHLENF